jgi:hypothetical protein
MVGRSDPLFMRLLVGVLDRFGAGVGCLLYPQLLVTLIAPVICVDFVGHLQVEDIYFVL